MGWKRMSDLGRDWRVEPKENDIRDYDVMDRDGNDVGEVDDLLIDTETNTVQYAVVGRGWLAQIFGREAIIVPLRKVDIDRQDASVHLDISREQLDNFPDYDSLDEPDLRRKVDEFWGVGMYERPMEGGVRYGRPAREMAGRERPMEQQRMEQPGMMQGPPEQVPSTRKEEYVEVSSKPVVVEEVRLYRIPSEQGPLTEEEKREIERRREEERRRGAA